MPGVVVLSGLFLLAVALELPSVWMESYPLRTKIILSLSIAPWAFVGLCILYTFGDY